jgi:excisionase family DNA binding protein
MKFYTIADISDLLKISQSNAYALVETGKLVAHRIGVGRGTIRVSEDDLQEFLGQSRSQREPEVATPTSRSKHFKI